MESMPLTSPDICDWNTHNQNLETLTSAQCLSVDTHPVPTPSPGTPSSSSSSRRSSVSVDAADSTSPYYRASRGSSGSRSSRRDPNKIPRPRNAFIIFRCEYCQKHAMESKGSDRSPTPEKTLSKRAGALWRTMDDDARRPYQEKAEQERIAHALMYPNYKYRPNRRGVPRRRASGSVSRREQVEMLMRASAERSQHDSGSECDSPVSLNSSSPEPGYRSHTPSSGDLHALAHRRSMSLPHIHEPYNFSHTYFLQPTSCVSSPGGSARKPARRAASASERGLSPSIPPPDCVFELDYGPGTAPYVYSPGQPSSSTMSLPEILALPECMSLQEQSRSDLSSPHVSPTASSHEVNMQEYFPPQSTSTPLFHRRQRSNTAPSTLSPLTVVSSSLQNWNGEVTAASASDAESQLPTFTFTPDTSSALTPTTATMVASAQTPSHHFACPDPFVSDSSRMVLVSGMDVDLERTPRRADFPLNVQEHYTAQFTGLSMSTSAAGYVSTSQGEAAPGLPMSSYDLESYMAGLNALSIAPAPYDMSPFQGVDFDDFIYIGHD